jgi:hypothetical protein
MRLAESTIRGKDSPDRQKARGWDGRFARTECCSAARWNAQNIAKLEPALALGRSGREQAKGKL